MSRFDWEKANRRDKVTEGRMSAPPVPMSDRCPDCGGYLRVIDRLRGRTIVEVYEDHLRETSVRVCASCAKADHDVFEVEIEGRKYMVARR